MKICQAGVLSVIAIQIKCGIYVPGANANAVAEIVLTDILMQAGEVPVALTFTETLFADEWEDTVAMMEKSKPQFQDVQKVFGSLKRSGSASISCFNLW